MAFLAGLLTAVAAAVTVALGVIYSGIYNVAATEPHNELVYWALSTTSRNSVEARAEQAAVPDLGAEARWKRGLSHFDATCRLCHGAPGVEPSPIGQGLRPRPPDLAKAVSTWSAGELFWILKHGIKMTGMPAFGPTHSEDELWAIVGFLQRLPEISADQYQQLVHRQNGQTGARAAADSPQDASAAAVVEMTNALRFAPGEVTIKVGDSVRWTNVCRVVHTVTADPDKARDSTHVALPPNAENFNSGNVEPGGTLAMTVGGPAPSPAAAGAVCGNSLRASVQGS